MKSNMGGDTTSVTLKDALFDPKYKKATWINVGYIFFHEFAGINVINLYSSQIFATNKDHFAFRPKFGTLLIGFANVIGCVFSILTIKKFNRRTIMIYSQLMFAFLHVLVGIASLQEDNFLMLVGIFLFVMIYLNTSGPLAWLYAAETTVDAGLGFCLFTLYADVLILSLTCPILMQPNIIGPANLFFIFGG